MKIELNNLKLTNFKGAKSLSVDFSRKTDVMGKNGSYKSTLSDAFSWLLFGKNSNEKKDFEIKTLDANNVPIPKIDHIVEGHIMVDGVTKDLKRCYREKWTKPKGQPEAIFSGHETLFWNNDVPMNHGEYKKLIDALCDEGVFKLLTNPKAFIDLNWKDAREILFEISGDITDDEIYSQMNSPEDEITKLRGVINSGKLVEDYKKQLSEKRKNLTRSIKEIPTRIDEIHRSLPEPVDTQSINIEIDSHNSSIDNIDRQISDQSIANKSTIDHKTEMQNQVFELQKKLQQISFADEQAMRERLNASNQEETDIRNQVKSKENERESVKSNISSNSQRIIEATNTIQQLTDQWKLVNTKEIVFNEDDFSCPSCKRGFENVDIATKKEELTNNFNTEKRKQISDISIQGKEAKEDKERLIGENAQLESKVTILTNEIIQLDSKLDELIGKNADMPDIHNPERDQLADKINNLNDQVSNVKLPESNDLIDKKSQLSQQIKDLNNQLSVNDQIDKGNDRISELEAQSKTLGQEISDIERTEFSIEEYTERKVEMVEAKINGRFSLVKFKMYKDLINGGKEPTCQVLIGGVPYADANTAAQINAGIDIINALSDHYDVYAPIFIDNAESVNQLLESQSQIIQLIVTRDEKLKVEHKELETSNQLELV